jgi:PiT family inorganic phosphate transporter
MAEAEIYIVLAGAFGLFMAWGIGANDVANAMGTSVGAKALTVKQALAVAAVFEFSGAVLAGGEVTATIRSGIVDPALFKDDPQLLVYGMLASLLAAGTWLMYATKEGWPVSTTHSIVGAVIGFGAIGVSTDAIQWDGVVDIVLSWVVTPLIAAAVAWAIFTTVQRLVLDKTEPLAAAKFWVPFYMFFAGFVMSAVTMFKGLKHVGLHLSTTETWLYSAGVGLTIALLGKAFISRIQVDPAADRAFHYATVEKVFGVLMVLTACCMAFSHGSNDVANAIGPVAAVVSIAQTGMVDQKSAVAPWLLLLGGAGIVIGLATYGQRVMVTIGEKITHLTPSRGFAAELSAATTIVVASGTGMPISTTHTLVGAVLGVGFARGIAAIDLGVVRGIFLSWVITVPAGAVLAVVFYVILRALLG